MDTIILGGGGLGRATGAGAAAEGTRPLRRDLLRRLAKLEERHGLNLSTYALRKGMIGAGLWRAKRHKPFHRAWRPRKACLGEMVQVDGSDHDWFEGRGPRCVLIAFIDDATSRVVLARFVEAEATLTLMRLTWEYLRRYGRPQSFYVDKEVGHLGF